MPKLTLEEQIKLDIKLFIRAVEAGNSQVYKRWNKVAPKITEEERKSIIERAISIAKERGYDKTLGLLLLIDPIKERFEESKFTKVQEEETKLLQPTTSAEVEKNKEFCLPNKVETKTKMELPIEPQLEEIRENIPQKLLEQAEKLKLIEDWFAINEDDMVESDYDIIDREETIKEVAKDKGPSIM